MTSPVPAGAGGVEREAIRTREQAATPGPWARGRCHDGKECVNAPEWDGGVWVAVTEHWATDYATEDAEFIAHARTDVPALLAALAAAEQRADTAEAANERVRDVVAELAESIANPEPPWHVDPRDEATAQRVMRWTHGRLAAALSSRPDMDGNHISIPGPVQPESEQR